MKKMHEKMLLLLSIITINGYFILASDPDPIQDFCIPNRGVSPIKTHHLSILPCKHSSKATTDDFVFSGLKSPGNFSDTGLATIPVTPLNFPGINTLGISFVRVDLKVGAINPPHFHPRATEVSHVVKGRVYSGFVDSNNRVFATVVKQGEVMVFPKGLVHFQMNVGDKPAMIFASLNSQNPGLQKIPSLIFGSGINDELLKKAFGLSLKQIGTMKRKFDPKKVKGN